MKKVITYGTYDLLHFGHINLLKRAKALGDYLIVGVTSDDFDKQRGKINVQQSLEERIAAVQSTGIVDKVIVEEYEGQKIDDIKKYDIDIFTVGSDWEGHFDYLKDYCNVIYLPRTEGVSSSEIRAENTTINIGIVGYSAFLNKVYNESCFVNGVNVTGLCSSDTTKLTDLKEKMTLVTDDYNELTDNVNAVYIHSHPDLHYRQVRTALNKGVHVLCESPISKKGAECMELLELAKTKGCILMEGIRTAYMNAYKRMLLLIKSGHIGEVVSVDATCTSLSIYDNIGAKSTKWGSLEAWGPTALLPVFQILGCNFSKIDFFDRKDDNNEDIFTKLNISYPNATATVKVGTGVKSEGELIISGTNGYLYIPAPWWKTDYFEIRYEHSENNKRFFYQLEGEGIRYELVEFSNLIRNVNQKHDHIIDESITNTIVKVFEMFYQ